MSLEFPSIYLQSHCNKNRKVHNTEDCSPLWVISEFLSSQGEEKSRIRAAGATHSCPSLCHMPSWVFLQLWCWAFPPYPSSVLRSRASGGASSASGGKTLSWISPKFFNGSSGRLGLAALALNYSITTFSDFSPFPVACFLFLLCVSWDHLPGKLPGYPELCLRVWSWGDTGHDVDTVPKPAFCLGARVSVVPLISTSTRGGSAWPRSCTWADEPLSFGKLKWQAFTKQALARPWEGPWKYTYMVVCFCKICKSRAF